MKEEVKVIGKMHFINILKWSEDKWFKETKVEKLWQIKDLWGRLKKLLL